MDDAITLGFENITFPFLFIAEGLAAAAVFLLLEICTLKKGSDKRENEDIFRNIKDAKDLKIFDMDAHGRRLSNFNIANVE